MREAEEVPGGQSRQLAPLSDTQEFLQEPPHLAIAEAPVGQRDEAAGYRRQDIESSEDPVSRRESIGCDVLCLRFQHQLWNVHARWAFEPALMAVDA